jgi:hypothetical protein
LEFEYVFGDKAEPKKFPSFDSGRGELGGLRIAINPRDTRNTELTGAIASTMQALLLEAGAADVLITSTAALATINAESNTFNPDLAIAIQFDVPYGEGDSVLTFCPGCFTKGELDGGSAADGYAVRFRHRFAHALVSGKLYDSAKLSMYLSESFQRNIGGTLRKWKDTDFEGTTCAMKTCPELASPCSVLSGMVDGDAISGIEGRNLYFNGVFAPAVAYTFPQIGCVSGKSPEAIAAAYVEGIKNFVKNEIALSQ